MRFSDKYGYTSPREVLRRECLDSDILNSLCNCFDSLEKDLNNADLSSLPSHGRSYIQLEEALWCNYLNLFRKDYSLYYDRHGYLATVYLLDSTHKWYEKLNFIEYSLKLLESNKHRNHKLPAIKDQFVSNINRQFQRLDYAYRVVNDCIVDLTNEEQITSIEKAIDTSSTIKTHISSALHHLAHKPTPDYRNSIKESISAVEVICREITGELTLGKALNRLEKKGVIIPNMLKVSFEKLYDYTNDKATGIRHALMDDTSNATYDEALFMLVSCSAFVNYLHAKI